MNSPCTKVCVMDADNRYCLGCRRTLDEIACWSQMSGAERAEIMARLPSRRSASSSEVAEVSVPPLA